MGWLLLVSVSTVIAVCVRPEESGTTLAKSETFLEIDAWVYDMQPDYYRGRGNFLIGAASSFRTTDGKTTTTLYNHTVMGFTQVNKTHVVLAIYAHHCLKILNRETLHTKILAGTEDSKGFQDGGVGVGMFYLPWQVKVDIRNWGKLLVTDQLNNALRSVDLDTGVVETVIQSGFNNPQGLEWAADNKLLITNHFHYISEVEWLDNGTVSGNVLAGSNEHGDVNGPFSEARFKMLYDIERFKGDKYLVADFESRKLKLIDVKKQTVSPFCFENERSCVTSSTLPYHPLSILNFEGEIFVGMRKDIYKLTKTKLMMRLQFQAKYIFPCLFFNDTSLLEQLENALSEKKKYINEACSNYCSASALPPIYTCDSDVITAGWLTDNLYPTNMKETPAIITQEVLPKFNDFQPMGYIGLSLSSQTIFATSQKNEKENTVEELFVETCADRDLSYDHIKRQCFP